MRFCWVQNPEENGGGGIILWAHSSTVGIRTHQNLGSRPSGPDFWSDQPDLDLQDLLERNQHRGEPGAGPTGPGSEVSEPADVFLFIMLEKFISLVLARPGPVRMVLWEPAPPAALRCFQVNMFGFSSDNYRVLVPPTQMGRYKKRCSLAGSDPAAPKRTSTPSRYTHTQTHQEVLVLVLMVPAWR